MPEREAEAWGVRLIQIWAPASPIATSIWDVYDEHFYFICEVSSGVFVDVFVDDSRPPNPALSHRNCELGCLEEKIDPYFVVSDVPLDEIKLFERTRITGFGTALSDGLAASIKRGA